MSGIENQKRFVEQRVRFSITGPFLEQLRNKTGVNPRLSKILYAANTVDGHVSNYEEAVIGSDASGPTSVYGPNYRTFIDALVQVVNDKESAAAKKPLKEDGSQYTPLDAGSFMAKYGKVGIGGRIVLE